MINSIKDSLHNWIPYRFFYEANETFCRWLYVGDQPYTDPFFDETILKCLKLSPNSKRYKCVSNVRMVIESAAFVEAVEPAAIIFHVSRCGSTTVSQLLSIPEDNIVLSEAPFFDDVLRLKSTYESNNTNSDELLKSAIIFYSQKRNGNEKRSYIKTDSWHVFFYAQLRRIYPKVPFVLLYRHPYEVLNSHRKLRGMHVVPGVIEKEVFGFDEPIADAIDLDRYAAKVIEKYLQEYINISAKDDNILLLNYSEGIIPVIEKIGAFTGNDFNDNVLSLMRERSGFHGKYPLQTFTEASSPNDNPAHLLKAVELYEQLEQIRSYQNSTAHV